MEYNDTVSMGNATDMKRVAQLFVESGLNCITSCERW